MVIGGQAVAMYGRPRFTEDIDITIALTPDEAEKILRAVDESFTILPEDVQRFIRETWVLPLEHRETGVRVDIIFSITPFEREAIEKAQEIEIDDVSVPYALPEYLVVQKIIAGRPRDLEDAAGIMEVQGETIDVREIERLVKTFGTGEEGKEWRNRWKKLKRSSKK
ncbi:MAG: nucleotidyltransferase [Deltaproteobacteria bacterium]|nr:nucleotidyltransferase [Deltaproteobacteria bacterium]